MAEFPAMPLWTDQWLADTGHLTWEERGLYMSVIILMWRTHGCQIPNDESFIKRRYPGNAGADAVAVQRLCQEFCKVSDDQKFIYHRRLKDQWENLQEIRKNNVIKANLRWNKEEMPSHSIAGAMPRQSNGNAEAMLSKTKTKTKTIKKEENLDLKGKQGFYALPHQPEFLAWLDYAQKNNQGSFVRELKQRTLENRPFQFEQQWPPGHTHH